MSNWSPGQEIVAERDRYIIQRLLGRGGFGVTYLAQAEKSNELIVIKTIDNNSSIRTYAEDVLIKEFTKLTKINNPYIIKASFFEKINHNWCLFLPYIRGKDLDQYVREKGILPKAEAIKYIRQVGQALNYLHHEAELVHRDIKPSNIMLNHDNSQVIVIDFGTAKHFNNYNHNLNTLKIYTPGYSAYEQCMGRVEEICHATDVYSLAATLYFLLTGQTPISVLERLQEDNLVHPIVYNPQIGEKLNNAIVRGMAIEAKDRPESVEEWFNLLQIKPYTKKKNNHQRKYNLTKDIKYSFTTEAYNEGKTYYFTLNENQEPIELGNGNYGSVYLGHDKDEKEYAVKILYEYDGSVVEDIIEKRFNSEITSSKNIRKVLGNSNDIPGIVLTVAGSKKFKESPAFNSLGKQIAIERLSQYCLVMEKYEKTLEELLEQGIDKYAIQSSGILRYDYLEQEIFDSNLEAKKVINQQVKSERDREILKNQIYELNGYDLLKCLNFQQRIANILPYLQDIAQGLNYLHKANYLHLDLKPANIFIKSFGKDVRCAIGDLGFLETSQLEPKSLLGKYDQLPLGTIHFRSPEQKQFRDVANVEIANDARRTLIIRDPKFRDTIIEQGDYVIFSKNKTKAYKIQRVEISQQKNKPVLITLSLNNEEKNKLKPCKQTQSNFYKVQGQRTDLFGIGAVAFNLLTCGQSPERFYESINSNYDTEELNVDSLIKYYEKVYSFESNEPGVTKIFDPFKDQKSTEYAPIQVVELILKCMLYKTQNTFFNYSKMEHQEPTDILLEQIIDLYKDDGFNRGQNAPFKIVRTDNLLYNGIIPPNPSEKEEKFIDSLQALKDLSQDKYNQRLRQGIWYFSQLARLVKTHLEHPSDFYFAEIHPQNIVIRKPNSSNQSKTLDTNFVVYRSKEAYQNDLRSDLVFTKIMMLNYQGNPYVPKLFSNMHREITLEKIKEESSVDNYNTYRFKYAFSDKYENKVEINDWIIIKPINQNHNWLFKVIKVNPQEQIITVKSIPSPNISQPNLELIFTSRTNINQELKRCIYYKNINPCLYYLHMLGIYLYNIFFLGINNNDYELVQKVFSQVQNEQYFINLNEGFVNLKFFLPSQEEDNINLGFLSKFLSDNDQPKKTDKREEILQFLVHIYLKLSFSEGENSYYHQENNDLDIIDSVLDDIALVKGKIADFLGIKVSKLESLNLKNQEKPSTKNINQVESEENYNFPSFHKLIFSQVSFRGNSGWRE
ncbi:MAG: protein kinase [Xenococcaceae cyanobacterium MO_167.B52]|nr:protein kinase [Xenococcaceae cyanobacterium MO_167.B52]